MSSPNGLRLYTLVTDLLSLTHEPEVQEFLQENWDTFAATAREDGMDVDTALSQCKTCDGFIPSDAIGAEEQARVYKALQTFSGRLAEGNLEASKASHRDTARVASDVYGVLSSLHADGEKWKSVCASSDPNDALFIPLEQRCSSLRQRLVDQRSKSLTQENSTSSIITKYLVMPFVHASIGCSILSLLRGDPTTSLAAAVGVGFTLGALETAAEYWTSAPGVSERERDKGQPRSVEHHGGHEGGAEEKTDKEEADTLDGNTGKDGVSTSDLGEESLQPLSQETVTTVDGED